ncbi:hypothetical protein E2C01_026600 [Portunus trituberculatus]|uniref:Uncharacterized protein n=1 Tax=Portunus trituberculatus TaxID=210409 RepID=A0A5B7EIL2_PORTR|nr:hypothetical protein [Portunus trituberculatus]
MNVDRGRDAQRGGERSGCSKVSGGGGGGGVEHGGGDGGKGDIDGGSGSGGSGGGGGEFSGDGERSVVVMAVVRYAACLEVSPVPCSSHVGTQAHHAHV